MPDYVHASSGVKFGIKAIRRAHPNISIPEGADLSSFGYLPLERTEPPTPGPGEIIVLGPPEEYAPGKWRETWRLEPKPPEPVPGKVSKRLREDQSDQTLSARPA